MSGRIFSTIYSAFGISLLAVAACVTAGRANVVISSRPTANMNCGDGFCQPTAARAVLNAGDLETFVSEYGNFRVMTTGRGVEATNIVVSAPLATPDSTSFILDALGAITVNAPVAIGGGTAELELQSGAGGELGQISFGPRGHITFGSTADLFDINGAVFQLFDSLPALASAIATENGAGFYVLVKSYDAERDGTYHSWAIGTTFTGYFEALGNAISHVKIDGSGGNVGLFAATSNSGGFGVIRNLRLEDVSVRGGGGSVGGLAGTVGGTVSQSSVSGRVTDTAVSEVNGGLAGTVYGSVVSSWSAAKVKGGNVNNAVGGLVGENYGTISNSHATGAVTGGGDIGGLVGANEDSSPTIAGSFASGAITTSGGGNGASAGGLVGSNFGIVTNSYAIGSVIDTGDGHVLGDLGGLVGFGCGATASYAAGALAGPASDQIGGVVGFDQGAGGCSDAYWNVTTSGVSQGAGNIVNDPGITGLTSKQLRSGLPAGFAKSIWNETAGINRGFPWLIANPPAAK